jgi:hypothetical protein
MLRHSSGVRIAGLVTIVVSRMKDYLHFNSAHLRGLRTHVAAMIFFFEDPRDTEARVVYSRIPLLRPRGVSDKQIDPMPAKVKPNLQRLPTARLMGAVQESPRVGVGDHPFAPERA